MIKKSILFIIIFSLYTIFNLYGQGPDTAWTRTFGGMEDDVASSIQQTMDGGYILGGHTYSFGAGGADFYLIKTDSMGNIEWTKTFGGDSPDMGHCVLQTNDGGYIIVGRKSFGRGSKSDVFIVKTDSLGNIDWKKILGGNHSNNGQFIQNTADGGYIITGTTGSYGSDWLDVFLIKLDYLGNSEWIRHYGGSGDDLGFCVRQTNDKGYIISGITSFSGSGDNDVYLLKTDSMGDSLWSKSFGNSLYENGMSVIQTYDKGYVVAGQSMVDDPDNRNVYLIKTDSTGDTLWTRTFGGTGDEVGYSVQQTTDGGYIVSGWTESSGTDLTDVYLIKTDSLGNIDWTKIYGGNDDDYGGTVCQTTDGGYIVAGATESYGAGEKDVWIIKLEPESGINKQPIPEVFDISNIHPNLFISKVSINYKIPKKTWIKISIYNNLGQKVKKLYSGKKFTGVHSVTWDGKDDSGKKLSSGIYFLRLKAGNVKKVKKLVLIR